MLGTAVFGHVLLVPRPSAVRPSSPPTAPFEPGKIGLPTVDYAGADAFDREPTRYKAGTAPPPGWWAENCPKLKQQYAGVPTVDRLTCQESTSDLAAIAVNDFVAQGTAGLSYAFDVDLGGKAARAVKKVGGWIGL